MTITEAIIFISIGAIAGFMNTVASSGSAITLPIMILAGIDPLVANGTNRLPIFVGFLTSVINYAKAGKIPWKKSFILAVPVAFGTAVGSILVGSLPKFYSELFIIIALVISLTLVLLNPKRFLITQNLHEKEITMRAILMCFVIGIWAGIIVLDTAIFILFFLVLMLKHELIQANIIKSFLILVVGLISLCIFVYNGQVDWYVGITLSIGSVIGSYIGSTFAMQESSRIWVFRIIKTILVLELGSLVVRAI
jgi:uncharacterized membrane protein YfcA